MGKFGRFKPAVTGNCFREDTPAHITLADTHGRQTDRAEGTLLKIAAVKAHVAQSRAIQVNRSQVALREHTIFYFTSAHVATLKLGLLEDAATDRAFDQLCPAEVYVDVRSEEHTSEVQSLRHLRC